jgi:hypothetical protein
MLFKAFSNCFTNVAEKAVLMCIETAFHFIFYKIQTLFHPSAPKRKNSG